MAAATIPELIQPGTLFVPSPNNFFSVASGAMPNTDDALDLLGASGDARAYQTAIAGVHYADLAGSGSTAYPNSPFSIAIWMNITSLYVGGAIFSNMICGVVPQTFATSGTDANGVSYNIPWIIGPYTVANSLRLMWGGNTSGSGARRGIVTCFWATGWHLYTWVFSGGTSVVARRDGVVTGTGAAGLLGSGTQLYTGAFNFGIGCPSQVAGPRSISNDIQIGKVAIWHGYALTVADELALVTSMTSGPPSP